MGRQGPDAQRPGVGEQFGGRDHGAGGVDHVVDDHRVLALHIADHLQGRDLVVHVCQAALMHEGDIGVESAGVLRGQPHPAGVG